MGRIYILEGINDSVVNDVGNEICYDRLRDYSVDFISFSKLDSIYNNKLKCMIEDREYISSKFDDIIYDYMIETVHERMNIINKSPSMRYKVSICRNITPFSYNNIFIYYCMIKYCIKWHDRSEVFNKFRDIIDKVFLYMEDNNFPIIDGILSIDVTDLMNLPIITSLYSMEHYKGIVHNMFSNMITVINDGSDQKIFANIIKRKKVNVNISKISGNLVCRELKMSICPYKKRRE